MSIEIRVTPYTPPHSGGGCREGERAISKALLHLRKKMDRNNVMDDYKDRRYFISKSEKKKRAKSLAKFRQKKRQEEEDY